jgi:hypothetical protein
VILAILVIGVPFSVLAAAMAFIITWEEYRHHYRDWKMPLKHALGTALITFAAFVIMLLLMSLVLQHFQGPEGGFLDRSNL